ncbi:Replication protein A 70 kDa DNA-binding subunit [Phytophthora cinnamomi]|uniref:Replication protein A 70 kDa DNA-binding subunit n=1 Tax=Phytophthora cinnamomi TaxID=4785 RepID=UPI003559B4DD|nr:Replication protein A 70 kDa DNA-binding subunit [Phytophthora cinnamomi]
MDAHSLTLTKLHRDVVNRSSDINKHKRYDYVVKFYAALSHNKKVFYLDETNFNLWCSCGRGWSKRGQRAVQTSVASKGKNIHVIAVISSTGVAYHESQFGSFTAELSNEFIRRFLRHIGASTPLAEVVLVLDITPCHTSSKDVFEEEGFAAAGMLKLGPYSPMLNPIENVFSVYKSAVKHFLARQRPAILRAPEGTTITEHRAAFLELAADPLFAEVVTGVVQQSVLSLVASPPACAPLRRHY